MAENTMDLYRRDTALVRRVQGAIDPFVPRSAREQLNHQLFLRCAAQQLDGQVFRPESLVPALATFAAAGILPNKYLHHGYLIVYKGIVTPVFGYQGLIHLAYQAAPASGERLLDVHTDLILDGDDFDADAPLDELVRSHRPRGDRDPRKDPQGRLRYGYARFRYAMPLGKGVHEFERVQVLAEGEMEAVRSGRGDGWKSFPWRMYQKAPVRRACQAGRIQLATLAGLATACERAGESGDPHSYRDAVRAMAAATGAEIPALEESLESLDARREDAVAEYAVAAAPFHAAMRAATCTIDDAGRHMMRLRELRAELGVDRDDIADGLFEQIRRECAKDE